MDELWMKIRAEKNTNTQNIILTRIAVNYPLITQELFMKILLVATLCKSGRAERMLKKKKTRIHMNTHEYEKINL